MTRTTRWIGFAATMVTCAALTACSGSSDPAASNGSPTTTVTSAPDSAPTTAPVTSPPSPAMTTVTTTVTVTPKPVAIATSTKDAAKEAALSDGEHAVLITGVNAAKKTVSLDVVQFFGGAAAAKAAAEDGGDSANDYWVRNANPRVRTLPVTDSAKITLTAPVGEAGSASKDVAKTLAELGDYSATGSSLFTVTIAGGRVTGLAEVYLP